MYELGLRHTRDLCTIMIAENERMPFDVASNRTIKFRRTEAGLINAREQLKASIKECLEGNHAQVIATRLWNSFLLGPPSEVSPHEAIPESDGASDDDEPGFLELRVGMEEALPELLAIMNDLSGALHEVAAILTSAQEEVAERDAHGTGTAAARLAIAQRVANQLQLPAERLDALADSWDRELSRVDAGLATMISAVREDPTRIDELSGLPDSVHDAGDQVQLAMESATQWADTVWNFGTIARPLRAPSRKMAGAIRRVIKSSEAFQRWDSQLQEVAVGSDPD